jgi:manganese-dependent ADP-ribose/CDP-alcohol diphosphatase
MLARNNPNNLSISGSWFNNLPINKYRWVPYNGGCSQQQIDWFTEVLAMARRADENVIVFCHQPIYSPLKPQSVIWNSEELLDIVHKFGNVVMWMAGHDHGGAYSCDPNGVHHLVPPAPIECDEGHRAYGQGEVYEDYLMLQWTGKTPSASKYQWPQKMKFKCPA